MKPRVKKTVTNIMPATVQDNSLMVDPTYLLKAERYDVFAKYLYAKWREKKIQSDWHERLYLNHIEVFNGCFESDGSRKCGGNSFLKSYNALLDSIKERGFSPEISRVPISRDAVIIDGAHRLAASLFHNKRIEAVQSNTEAPTYNYRWFLDRGLEPKWADAIATQACELLPNSFIIVIYPSAQGKKEALQSLIEQHASIWYQKSLILEGNGPLNLIRQIYHKEPWVGRWEDKFVGAQNKASWCFASPGPLRAYLVESSSKEILALKIKIRELFQIENHSVHINDTHEEAKQLSWLLFNDNSINFMNSCNLKQFKWFQRLFQEYKKWLSQKCLNINDYCIDASAVLAAYGIREGRDIDFMHDSAITHINTGYKEISSHNSEAHWYKKTPDEIVYNPENYFYFYGVKFAALHVVLQMKKNRNENKDQDDVRLISDFISGGGKQKNTNFLLIFKRIFSPRYLYHRTRFMALKVRFLINAFRK